jgi:hypothetical protein
MKAAVWIGLIGFVLSWIRAFWYAGHVDMTGAWLWFFIGPVWFAVVASIGMKADRHERQIKHEKSLDDLRDPHTL